ncbi:MAG: hypothetical protein GY936_13575 [Ignavibacteriae bacterium]|nr:hypothetical protein [Ignavibacteriota bacterium]
MNNKLIRELERLTANAAIRREELLLTGLKKSRSRKYYNIIAGILALISASAITTVIADIYGSKVVEIIAALFATISGSISLIITAYFSDDEILNMLNGSAKYLALRESVYRLVIQPNVNEDEVFNSLTKLQDEYAKLDEVYSRYFSLNKFLRYRQSAPNIPRDEYNKVKSTVRDDVDRLNDIISTTN